METKIYQTAKEFFKFLNNYEADIWIRGSRAFDVNGELIAEYNTSKLWKQHFLKSQKKQRLKDGRYCSDEQKRIEKCQSSDAKS